MLFCPNRQNKDYVLMIWGDEYLHFINIPIAYKSETFNYHSFNIDGFLEVVFFKF